MRAKGILILWKMKTSMLAEIAENMTMYIPVAKATTGVIPS